MRLVRGKRFQSCPSFHDTIGNVYSTAEPRTLV
jgi:hypothetical protein